MRTSKGYLLVVLLACVLSGIGLAAGFIQACLCMKRDGNPVALIFWCVIVGCGLWIFIPMIQYFFRILDGKG